MTKLKSITNGLSIQKRLLFLILILFVPFLLIQGFTFYQWFQKDKEAEMQANLELCRIVAKTFNGFVENVFTTQGAIGLAATASPAPSAESLRHILSQATKEYPAFRNFGWVSPEGQVLVSSIKTFEGGDLSKRDYYLRNVSGEERVVSDLITSRLTEETIFVISRAVRDSKGRLMGIVITSVLPDKLDEMLAVKRSRDAGISLIDSNGTHVYRYPATPYTPEQRNWRKLYPPIEDAYKGKEVMTTVVSGFSGKKRVVAFTPISSIGWVASASSAERDIVAGIISTLFSQALLVLLVTMAAFGVALAFSRPISASITRLRNHALALGRGEIDKLTDDPGPSELKDLADAFDKMAVEIRAREEALRESEQRWATTLASIGDAVIATDTSGSITFMNAVAESLTGWTIGEASMRPAATVFNIINEQTRKRVENPVAKVLREGMIVGLANHTILVRKDGTEVPIDDSGAPIRDGDGKTMGVVLVFHDITERKQMEDELHRSRDELELRVQKRTDTLRKQAELLELAHNAIIVRDMASRITFWNHGAEELYGWTKDEAEGVMVHQLLKTKFPVSFDDTMMTLMRRGTWEGELDHTTKDGRTITVQSRRALQRDEAGNPAAIIEINLDITAAKVAEDQLRQAHKMEALGTLAGGIAHDFNNLLGAVIGFTELIQDDLPEGNPGHRHAARVLEAGLRGRDLVKQMLTFSRKSEQEKQPLRLSSIVKESAKLLRSSIPTTISMNVNVTSESGLILADLVQIQQVVMNLCTNAYHAMLEKAGTLDIELSDFSVGPSNGNVQGIEPDLYMRLTVRDTGIGIPEQIKDRIFDPFFTTKVVGEGTGLGLSVVMGIVKQTGGYITVESEPGKGSTFSVYFPKVTGELEADLNGKEETLPTGTERILFVDDEDALLEMGEQLLTRLCYKVTSENSSAAALALVEENPSYFDLVITDQTMPDMTGVELAKRILALRPDLPVILCTGFSHLVDADSAKAAGIRGFAMKPLTKAEIAKTVRNVLDENSSV